MRNSQLKLLFGEKGADICTKVLTLQERLPRLFAKEMAGEVARCLLNCPKTFLDSHSISFLRRFFFSWHRLTKDSKQVRMRVVSVTPSIYGIAIALTAVEEHENLSEKQIVHELQNLVSGVKLIPGSYLSNQNNQEHFFYLEIKKMKGGVFSVEERAKLKLQLPLKLQQRNESFPSFIFSENVEDLFKNIRRLSQGLKYADDLPQVMISFVEYSQKTLKFLVIALRVIKPGTLSISQLRNNLPFLVQFSLEEVFCAGKLRSKYPKEASLFTLEVNSSVFLHNHQKINLRSARQYVAKALENMLGPFRDCNGGLLNKESEQLSVIRKMLEEKNKSFFPFFEDLFYEIKPIVMRALISPRTGMDMALLCKKMLDIPLEKERLYHVETAHNTEADIAIIKTKQKDWKTSFSQSILAHSTQIAGSHFEHEGYLYLCFFHQYPERPTLTDLIEKELKHSVRLAPGPRDLTLRINFQGGDPPSLNPRLSNDIQCHTLAGFLFEGLMRINESGAIEPACAEAIEVSSDKKHYTFQLRLSHWSNGEEVTANHFEKAWKRALLENSAFTCPDLFHPIKNATKARQRKLSPDDVGIVVKDAKTLCVELDYACPHFLNLLTLPRFLPLHGESEEPIHFNGAFTLAEWKRGHHLFLSQNPYYWDARRLKLGGIRISMVRDPHIFYVMFQNGELDLIGDPISPLPPELLKRPEVQNRLTFKNISRAFWIHCNTRTHLFSHAGIRRALSLSLNRKKLIERVFLNCQPIFSPLPIKYSTFEGKIEGDPETARAHFTKALEELKIDKNHIPPLIITHSDLSFEKPLIEELKAQWKEMLGISILSQELPWNEFSASLDCGNYELCGLFRRDLFNHAMSYLSFFQKSIAKSPGWKNEELEIFFEGFNQTENLKKIESILVEESPVIPLVNQNYVFLNNERIKGISWNNNGCLNIMGAWIDEKNIDNYDSPFFNYISTWKSHEKTHTSYKNAHT